MIEILILALTIAAPQTIPTDGPIYPKSVINAAATGTDAAWVALKAEAAGSITGTISLVSATNNDNDDQQDTRILARAFVYMRDPTNFPNYDQDVEDYVMGNYTVDQGALYGTENETDSGTSGLRAFRSIFPYVCAYEYVWLEDAGSGCITNAEHDIFLAWCETLKNNLWYRNSMATWTIQEAQEERPNNWGCMAGASRLALAIITGDTTDVAAARNVYRG